jgi:hypothetical protein
MSSFLIGVTFRVFHELVLALESSPDFLRRDDPLFDEAVGNDRRGVLVKEIEHAVIDPAEANPQLVDAVAQEIRFGPAELLT